MVSYKRFKIGFKILIIIFGLLTMLSGILYVTIEMRFSPDGPGTTYIFQTFYFNTFGYRPAFSGRIQFIVHPLYWLFVVLFFIGFLLSFGNIKKDISSSILKNIGYINGIILLIGLIGQIIIGRLSTLIYPEDLTSGPMYFEEYYFTISNGFIAGIILGIIIIMEPIIQFHSKIIKEEAEIVRGEPIRVHEREISGKVFCSLCGAEILDKKGGFCSKCGAPIK